MRLIVVVAVLAICKVASAGEVDGESILAKYCVRCHGEKRAESDFGFAANTSRMVAAGLIVPGNPDASPIVRRIAAGEMPPSGPRPNKAEQWIVRQWIAGMKQATKFRNDPAIAKTIVDDAAQLDPATRTNSRWLILTYLANAGVPDTELEVYRKALAILLASLTWEAVPNVMVAVDAERTIYRIDLRELGWTAATWNEILAVYPYGVAYQGNVPQFIRADWFVATASRGALYNAILGLPDREDLLGTMLGIDLGVAGDARAGFNNSGVSVNNRVIERRTTHFGAYWRSYDFASSVGVRNVFRHPLDFVPSGGELIFNLPDGMQAYMLFDGKGHRIDKAPTAIVSDSRRPDRAVETAVSCMGCHGAGIIAHADQVRATTTDETVLRSYVDAATLGKFYTDDAARFATALSNVGATPQPDATREPISALTSHYEADLDVRAAAAEIGLDPTELTARLSHSEAARKDLGALLTTGGTIKRDAWVAAFSRVIIALKAGVPFKPFDDVVAHPVIWLDRARNTWFFLANDDSREGADLRCRSLGARTARSTALVEAASEGLAGGLHLTSVVAAWARDRKLDTTNQRFGYVVDVGTATVVRAIPTEVHQVICVQEAP